MTSILTERLSLRPLELGDADAMFQYRSDPEIQRFQNREPGSVAEVRDFVAGHAGIEIDTPGQ